MVEKQKSIGKVKIREKLTLTIILVSVFAIVILAVVVIQHDESSAKDIFNSLLPVFTSWVGTVLAFYYGRENFESANAEVGRIVSRISPEMREVELVAKHMRSYSGMNCLIIPQGKSDADFNIGNNLLSKNVSRLPILNSDKSPKYMIHESSLHKYISSGGKREDTLKEFIEKQKTLGIFYDINKGFIVIPKNTSLGVAKIKLDESSPCMDIFVSDTGSIDDPLKGWISNKRLATLFDL